MSPFSPEAAAFRAGRLMLERNLPYRKLRSTNLKLVELIAATNAGVNAVLP
jgi:hypothetical protein